MVYCQETRVGQSLRPVEEGLYGHHRQRYCNCDHRPQNDFLSPEGVTRGLVGKNVEENNTVANLGSLLAAAKAGGYTVYVSPHYYYPTDHGWHFGGTVEAMMHDINMFDRVGALDLDGFEGSGADWLEELKPYLTDKTTIVASPHKVYSPSTNDLSL